MQGQVDDEVEQSVVAADEGVLDGSQGWLPSLVEADGALHHLLGHLWRVLQDGARLGHRARPTSF